MKISCKKKARVTETYEGPLMLIDMLFYEQHMPSFFIFKENTLVISAK